MIASFSCQGERGRMVRMENEEPIGNPTLDELKQELEKYELDLKTIYLQVAATKLPTPEQIQNWDCIKEANRIQIEKLHQSIKELEDQAT
jgi:hypothetical protein